MTAALFLNVFLMPGLGFKKEVHAEEGNEIYGNIALGKEVTSNINSPDVPKVVDGFFNGAVGEQNSRLYVSGKQAQGSFIEISLQEEYSLIGSGVFSGFDAAGKVDDVAQNYIFQYWDGVQWQDIPGSQVVDNQQQANTTYFEKPVQTNKVKFLYTGMESFRIKEIVLYNENSDNNIAYGKKVIASSYHDGGSSGLDTRKYPCFIVDGDRVAEDVFWQPHINNDDEEHWIEVDFGKEFKIDRAHLYTGNEDGSKVLGSGKLQYNAQGEWIDVPDFLLIENKENFLEVHFKELISTDKVRLVCTEKGRDFIVRELQVFQVAEDNNQDPEEPESPKVDDTEGEDKPAQEQEKKPKKVYADYHGPRYTRDIQGSTGLWSYTGNASKSKTTDTFVNYNGDLIGKDGRNQIAATAYPIVGMQSQNDPDYIEYQILLAKTAHIDGFFVEWGFQEHSSNQQLQAMQKIAEKYDFKIGVNWCDAWLFYDWITKYRPEVVTREDKLHAFEGEVQYLIDQVFNTTTGPTYDGHPIIYLFGGGPTPQEFEPIKDSSYLIPEGLKEPWFFRRAPIGGSQSTTGEVNYKYENTDWHKVKLEKPLVEGPFGWMPPRVRDASTEQYSKWDKYATSEDVVSYLDTLTKAINNESAQIKLRNSVVVPGMDNRGCAGWGTNFTFIPRENGKTYEDMWNFNVEHQEDIDVVYIASWNDYTEGHQIEPTMEDGYREIATTQKYAAQFKEEVPNEEETLQLPEELFHLRKKYNFLKKVGIQEDTLIPIQEKLNEIGQNISTQNFDIAKQGLQEIQEELTSLRSHIQKTSITFNLQTEGVKVQTSSNENVALNKPITANSNNENAFYLVDGVDTDTSIWQGIGEDEYRIEIDLEDMYNLVRAEVISGTADETGMLTNFTLQYLDQGEWKDIPGGLIEENPTQNLDIKFSNSVTTQKVRVLCQDKGEGIVIREIKLFSNQFPQIDLKSPKKDETLLPDTPLKMIAHAFDRDGNIEKVEFYINERLVEEPVMYDSETEEYSVVIQGFDLGEHRIIAKAYDNQGAFTKSQEIQIRADLPLVNIAYKKPIVASSEMGDSPAIYAVDGEICDDLRWRTNVKDAEHWLEIDLMQVEEICGVEFITGYSNGGWAVKNMKLQAWDGEQWVDIPGLSVQENKKTQVNLLTEQPVQTNKVRFYSNDGTRGLRVREIKVLAYNKKPMVELVKPIEKSELGLGESLTIQVKAMDTDGEITKIELYQGEKLLDKEAIFDEALDQYTFTIEGVLQGSYQYTVKAYDNAGLWSKSSTLVVTVKGEEDSNTSDSNEDENEGTEKNQDENSTSSTVDQKEKIWIDNPNMVIKKVPQEAQKEYLKNTGKGTKEKVQRIPLDPLVDLQWKENKIKEPTLITLPIDQKKKDIDKEKVGIFYYKKDEDKWIYVGGILNEQKDSIIFTAVEPGIYAMMENQVYFEDLQQHWAQREIEVMASKEMVLGRDDSFLYPDQEITRAEFFALLARLVNIEPLRYTGEFQDIRGDEWYADVIQALVEEGVLLGNGQKEMKPNDRITREEMAVFITRMYQREKEISHIPSSLEIAEDSDQISDWAKEAVSFVSKQGFMTGFPSGHFEPKGHGTRAQAIVTMKRIYDRIH